MTIKTHGRMMTNKTIGADQLAVSDYGTDNQALVTDGAGSIRWATVGGGAVGVGGAGGLYIKEYR
jgi:hypothetical protein